MYIEWDEFDLYLSGMRAVRIAFSCTCQPNIKEERPHIITHLKNFFGSLKAFSLKNKLQRAGCLIEKKRKLK